MDATPFSTVASHDYITTRRRDSNDILITRAMRGAECWTDHRLIRAKLNIRILPRHHKCPKLSRQAFNTARLLSAKYQQEFQSNLDDKLAAIGPLTGQKEKKYNQSKEVVTETAPSLRYTWHVDGTLNNKETVTNCISFHARVVRFGPFCIRGV